MVLPRAGDGSRRVRLLAGVVAGGPMLPVPRPRVVLLLRVVLEEDMKILTEGE